MTVLITTCGQPWTWEMSSTKTASTKMKKQKVIAEINNLGYNFDNSDTTVTLRLYNSEYNLNNRLIRVNHANAENESSSGLKVAMRSGR